MDFHRTARLKSGLLFFLLVFNAAMLPSATARADVDQDLEKLDKRFHTLSANIYQYLCQQRRIGAGKVASLSRLARQADSLEQTGKHVTAICLVKNNLDTVDRNIDDPAVYDLLALLLKHNELKTAENILTLLQEEGDRGLVSNARYVFAQHELRHKEWQKVLDDLDGIIGDLPAEEAAHALFMQGLALQGIKQHRKAIKIYLSIDESSKYYPAAMLNTSVAYIRQGWWTDAHMLISNLLKSEEVTKSEEFVNRLYLVLGYSLLKEGFFRESREAFRNVSLDSKYTNRALLGIALTATNQEDFVGALNAINILKGKESQDLTIDESYLLLPYIYEKLMQYMTATASYTEAVNYYQKRTRHIQASMASDMQFNAITNFSNNHNELRIADTVIDFSRYYPESFLQNYTELDNFRKYITLYDIKDSKVTRTVEQLHADYARLLTRMVQGLLDKRIKYLNSYMNQARYGLARLYDINAKTEN